MPFDPFFPQLPRLLQVWQVADVLGSGHEYVRRALRDGRLKGKRLGNRWRVDRADLDTFIAALPEGDVHRVSRGRDGPRRHDETTVHVFPDAVTR